jgi:hypothetical protein
MAGGLDANAYHGRPRYSLLADLQSTIPNWVDKGSVKFTHSCFRPGVGQWSEGSKRCMHLALGSSRTLRPPTVPERLAAQTRQCLHDINQQLWECSIFGFTLHTVCVGGERSKVRRQTSNGPKSETPRKIESGAHICSNRKRTRRPIRKRRKRTCRDGAELATIDASGTGERPLGGWASGRFVSSRSSCSCDRLHHKQRAGTCGTATTDHRYIGCTSMPTIQVP